MPTQTSEVVACAQTMDKSALPQKKVAHVEAKFFGGPKRQRVEQRHKAEAAEGGAAVKAVAEEAAVVQAVRPAELERRRVDLLRHVAKAEKREAVVTAAAQEAREEARASATRSQSSAT